MRTRLTHLLILAAFSAGVGHLAWSTFGVPRAPDYVVGGEVTTLRAPEPRGKRLYLRRCFHLPRRPKHAWVQVLARDRLELFLNGKRLDQRTADGYPVALVVDLTPHLHAGKNVLAVAAGQAITNHLPEVAVTGAYWLEDVEHRFGTEGPWRCRAFYERRGDYWFTTDFDDGHWPPAETGRAALTVPISMPPRAVTTFPHGQCISPDIPSVGDVVLRRELTLPERARHAWLRVWSTAPYRLAVNGTIIDAKEEQLGTTQAPPATQWTYDVSPLVHSGTNVVSLALSTRCPPPHLLLDMEVEGRSGKVYPLGTDETWQWRAAPGHDWLASTIDSTKWRACQVEHGDVGRLRWKGARRLAEFVLPWEFRASSVGAELGLVLLIALTTWVLTRIATRLLLVGDAERQRRGVSPAVLALVPSAALAIAGIMAVYDPRVPQDWVYRPGWLILVIGLVLVQWVVLRVLLRRQTAALRSSAAPRPWTRRPGIAWCIVAILLVCGAVLRIRGMADQPLTPDESGMYRVTLGFLERGYPSAVIHEDMPLGVIATSELVYVGTALSALVFDNDRVALRAPAVCWGILTIGLLFLTVRRMFGTWVGVVAAAIYTFSPYAVQTSQIGRYYSQLQGFTLLTIYFFYRTVEGTGPLNRRQLWLAVISFICMYLSWEASALLAPGLILTALICRRHCVRTLFFDRSVWLGLLVVGVVVLVQTSHRTLQQTLRMFYGSGATDVTITPMWTYPRFDLWYYIQTSSWTPDLLIPVLALLVAGLLMIRHRFRKPVRALFVMFLGLAFAQVAILPVTATRYSYHLLPMFVILAAVAIVAVAEQLARVIPSRAQPLLGGYARIVSAAFVTVLLLVSSGMAVHLTEMTDWRTGLSNRLNVLKTPDQEAAARYVRERRQPGDAVVVVLPNQPGLYLDSPMDYWVQTQMQLQVTLDDYRTAPLHRLFGVVTLPNLEQLQDLFSRYRRVWYITSPASPVVSTNTTAASRLIRENMEVVYEDFRALVFLFGENHLPAESQSRSEVSLDLAPSSPLP